MIFIDWSIYDCDNCRTIEAIELELIKLQMSLVKISDLRLFKEYIAYCTPLESFLKSRLIFHLNCNIVKSKISIGS